MESALVQRVAGFVREQGLFPGGGVVVAASGGADSMALMAVMNRLREMAVAGLPLVAAHVHHGLRCGDADADEVFVAEMARRFDMRFVRRAVDVRAHARRHALSIETAGRQLRRAALTEIAAETGCTTVATGHHLDDNAETLIQRMARGTGYRGLCGIRPVVDFDGLRFARPLLCVRRAEIEAYLRQAALPWRTDVTNADCRFRRNFIRHRLLPEIARGSSGRPLAESLFELSRAAQRLSRAIGEAVDAAWARAVEVGPDGAVMDVRVMTSLSPPAKVELIRRALSAAGCGLRAITSGHYERLVALADDDGRGRQMDLPGRFTARRKHGQVMIQPAIDAEMQTTKYERQVTLCSGGRARFGQFVIESRLFDADGADLEAFRRCKSPMVEWFDADAVGQSLVVRQRMPGDRFIPLGCVAAKNVGKFLTDQKVTADVRRRVLVFEAQGGILWVCPVRMSQTAKVTGRTRQILEVRVSSATGQV